MHARIATLVLLSGLALPATTLAQADDQLPITAVTLYRSGVGSFERQGTVTDDSSVVLSFEADQINDILKSLVVVDLDGGRVGAVGYSSDEPISRRLQALGLSDPSQLSLGVLLSEFQGARVTLATTDGELTGRILGVETHTIKDDEGTTRQIRRLSVMTESMLTTVDEPDIRSVHLLDPSLQSELTELLIALGSQRTEQTRTIEIDLQGDGDRRVMAAYVQETPIWKTSYRLVLPEDDGDDLHIEGWAIIENTTDHDWEDITLSLVAGQPIGFQMDLATPLYLQRPEIPVPVELAAAPKMYERGAASFFNFSDAEEAPASGRGLQRSVTGGQSPFASSRPASPEMGRAQNSLGFTAFNLDDAMGRSTMSMASGGDEGEIFFFRLNNPVSVDKRQSAMLPIITGAIEGRRVSVFSPSTQGNHPYRGVELTNSTNLKLMPGPLSVYDGSVFAGDSQIGYIGAGERRMLAYAVDLDVDAERTNNSNSTIQHLRIADGVIHQTEVIENNYTITLTNHDSARDRTVVVEVPRLKDWTLSSELEPYETTEGLYRFEVEIPAGESAQLSAAQARQQQTRIGLISINLPTLLTYQRNGAASQGIIDAFKGYASRRADVQDTQSKIQNNEAENTRVTTDQLRIRDLLRAINRQDSLYARYMQQLETHEDSLDVLRADRQSLSAELIQNEAELNRYTRTLKVD